MPLGANMTDEQRELLALASDYVKMFAHRSPMDALGSVVLWDWKTNTAEHAVRLAPDLLKRIHAALDADEAERAAK